MSNEFGVCTNNLNGAIKNDTSEKSATMDRYCVNGPSSLPASVAPPPPPPSSTDISRSNLNVGSPSWNYNPYLGNFYNYYSSQTYNLGDVSHQYANQKCSAQFARNYQQPLPPSSVLQCCDPRCQLLPEHSKYPCAQAHQKSKRSKNYYSGILDLPKSDIGSRSQEYVASKYTPMVPYSPHMNDLNARPQMSYNAQYQTAVKASKSVLLAETNTYSSSDFGKQTCWNKPPNLWNPNIPNSYYPSMQQNGGINHKYSAPLIEQNGIGNAVKHNVPHNHSLLDTRSTLYDQSYLSNYHYLNNRQIQANNIHEHRRTTEECSYSHFPPMDNGHQYQPLYNAHNPLSNGEQQNFCYKDLVLKTTIEKTTIKQRVVDKGPISDVREFLSTWDEGEDDKPPDSETPVIVLDCTSLEGDVLAKVKEKLGDNISDCNSLGDSAASICELESQSNATVLKVVDDTSEAAAALPKHTSVIQDSNAENVLKSCGNNTKVDDCADKSSSESSHLNSDGFMTWYSSSKKREDHSYDLVEMTERLVNSVDKLFGEPEKKTAAAKLNTSLPNIDYQMPNQNVLDDVYMENEWNMNFNYNKNSNEKAFSNPTNHYYNQAAKYKLCSTMSGDVAPNVEKNSSSCYFNANKTHSKPVANNAPAITDYNGQSKVQDFSIKYKSTFEHGTDYYSAESGNMNYPYYNSYYFPNANPNINNSCSFTNALENNTTSKHSSANYVDQQVHKNSVNDSEITQMKADLEKSLNEIANHNSYDHNQKSTLENDVESCGSADGSANCADSGSNILEIGTIASAELSIEDPSTNSSDVPYSSVIHKTGVCNSPERELEEKYDDCENSLLSMPSLSPPPTSMTLETSTEDHESVAQEDFLSTNLNSLPELEGDTHQPLNLALEKDIAKSDDLNLCALKRDKEKSDSSVDANTSRIDDGYYSVENQSDYDGENHKAGSSNAEESLPELTNINDEKMLSTVSHQSCIVSREKYESNIEENKEQSKVVEVSCKSTSAPSSIADTSESFQPNNLKSKMNCKSMIDLPNLSELSYPLLDNNCDASTGDKSESCSSPHKAETDSIQEAVLVSKKSSKNAHSTCSENVELTVDGNELPSLEDEPICLERLKSVPANSVPLDTSGEVESLPNLSDSIKEHPQSVIDMCDKGSTQSSVLTKSSSEHANGSFTSVISSPTNLHLISQSDPPTVSERAVEKIPRKKFKHKKHKTKKHRPHSDPFEGINRIKETDNSGTVTEPSKLSENDSVIKENTNFMNTSYHASHSVKSLQDLDTRLSNIRQRLPNDTLLFKCSVTEDLSQTAEKITKSKACQDESDHNNVVISVVSDRHHSSNERQENSKLGKHLFNHKNADLPMKKRKQDLSLYACVENLIADKNEIQSDKSPRLDTNHKYGSADENHPKSSKKLKMRSKLNLFRKKSRRPDRRFSFHEGFPNGESSVCYEHRRSKSMIDWHENDDVCLDLSTNLHSLQSKGERTDLAKSISASNPCISDIKEKNFSNSSVSLPASPTVKLPPIFQRSPLHPDPFLRDSECPEDHDEQEESSERASYYDYSIPSVAPTPQCDLIKEDKSECGSVEIYHESDSAEHDYPPTPAFNAPSTPNCDFSVGEEVVKEFPTTEVQVSNRICDEEAERISSKAPSPCCILNDIIADEIPERNSYQPFTVLSPASSVAPSPQCDIVDGVILDSQDLSDESPECDNNNNNSHLESVHCTTFFSENCGVPTLQSLAFEALDGICAEPSSSLEVWVDPERTEIIIHAEDQRGADDFVVAGGEIETNEAPLTAEMTHELHLQTTTHSEADDESMKCQCLIISNEESIICVHCSSSDASSMVARENHRVENVVHCDEDLVIDGCAVNHINDLQFVNDCIEESFIDQKISCTPPPGPVYPLPNDAVSAYETTSHTAMTESDIESKLKVQLPWHKIFKLNESANNNYNTDLMRELELGPAQIEVRLSTDDGSRLWKVVNSGPELVSPVLKVKRLVLQPASKVGDENDENEDAVSSINRRPCIACGEERLEENTDEVNTCNSDVDKKTVRRPPRRTTRFNHRKKSSNKTNNNINGIIGVPKMVIKKTSYREYRSYLQANEILLPTVRLKRIKYLDELARKMTCGNENSCTVNIVNLEEIGSPDQNLGGSDNIGGVSTSADTEEDEQFEIDQVTNTCLNYNPNALRIEEAEHFSRPEGAAVGDGTVPFPKSLPERHHCLLCHRSYSSEELYQLHMKSKLHRHLELTQRKTIHAMYRYFTGHLCPRLRPLSAEERKKMKWKPRQDNVNHFYHQKTPLQIALHKSVFHHRK